MHKGVYFHSGQAPRDLTTLEEISDCLSLPDGITWVNLESSENGELLHVLRDLFKFHPLAIEDCQSQGYQSPKIDDYGDYIFLIAHAIDPRQDLTELKTLELDVFLGSHFLVTCCADAAIPFMPRVHALFHKDSRFSTYTSDFLCHSILDALVDDYLPLIDQMESEVEYLEDSVMEKPTAITLSRLLSLKHSIMELRRIIGPQREVLNRLSRNEYSQITTQSLIYFRDIYDHLIRIQDLSDLIRDILTGTLDIYLNANSLRLNEIMKALTIVSTIFLPLSFVTGAFGMNFSRIPGASHPWGFYITCVALLFLGLGMLLYFRKRNWF